MSRDQIHEFGPNSLMCTKKLVTMSPFCIPFPYSLLVLFHDVHGHKVYDINFKIYLIVLHIILQNMKILNSIMCIEIKNIRQN